MQPSKSLFAAPVDEERNTRYLETRRKAVELFARHGFSRVSMRDLASTTTLITKRHCCLN